MAGAQQNSDAEPAGIEKQSQTPLLFVLTDDFGEQGTMNFFTSAQPFADRITVLASPQRAQSVRADSSYPVLEYDSVAGILEVVDRLKPGTVIFCSAYLFVRNGILTLAAVTKLVRELNSRPCRLVTTDPLLGLVEHMRPWHIDLTTLSSKPGSFLQKLRTLPRQLLLYREMRYLSRLLTVMVHLYPVPVSSLQLDRRRQALSFFNPSLAVAAGAGSGDAAVQKEKSWIIVMSEIDMGIQIALLGKQKFTENLYQRMTEIVASGRPVILVAPELAKEIFSARQWQQDITLLTDLPYQRFVALLRQAELAIYFNVYSNSAFVRLINRQPVIFFDRGHVARIFRGSERIALKSCFGDSAPLTRSVTDPLEHGSISSLLNEATARAAIVASHLDNSISPAELLARLEGAD